MWSSGLRQIIGASNESSLGLAKRWALRTTSGNLLFSEEPFMPKPTDSSFHKGQAPPLPGLHGLIASLTTGNMHKAFTAKFLALILALRHITQCD